MVEMGQSSNPGERCGSCGFDSGRYDRADTISSQRVLPAVLAAAIEEVAGDDLGRRPDDHTWSMIEYVGHVREIVVTSRLAIESALAEPGVDAERPLVDTTLDPVRPIDRAPTPDGVGDGVPDGAVQGVVEGATREFEAMQELLAGLDDENWSVAVTGDGDTHTVGWIARHVIHEGLHHLADVGRIRARFGHGARPSTGEVVGLHVSGGGVPKQAVASALVETSGLVGDRQADRRHHGRPVQAVCLWSAEVIAELRSQGHPIFAGAAGENITVAGVDWAGLRPGSRIDIGPVPMLITAHAIPCAKNAQWFHDRDFNRILHQNHPGSSRLYALPLEAGPVAVGDRVEVEPSTDPI